MRHTLAINFENFEPDELPTVDCKAASLAVHIFLYIASDISSQNGNVESQEYTTLDYSLDYHEI